MKSAKHQQILARYYSEFLEESVDETFWGLILDERKGLFQVNNIPFYGAEFSNGDKIQAKFDAKMGIWVYQNIVEHSGHSTIQVVQSRENYNMGALQRKFDQLGAYTESLDETFFVMDLPPNKSYGPIYKELLLLEKNNDIAFAEPVLTQKHLQESHRKTV